MVTSVKASILATISSKFPWRCGQCTLDASEILVAAVTAVLYLENA
jgi:bacterioferritin-associated ferredoxin